MYKFIQKKQLDIEKFSKYIESAQESNQFTNYGKAVQLLEERARTMLKIDNNKAIIATSSGSTALSAILYTIQRENNDSRVATQAFNFPAASQGACQGAFLVDITPTLEIHIENENLQKYIDTVIVTNCFGHLQNLDNILKSDKRIVFDNAATPYSFWKGKNSCNYGFASMVSLHHTKPIGFGEGGLVIIDKEYEKSVRDVINFGWLNEAFNERGGNYKMSELSAAGILQWWDQFDIDDLAKKYFENYCKQRYNLRHLDGDVYIHFNNPSDTFFPSCLPFINREPTEVTEEETKKYYKPLGDYTNSKYVYDRIICHPITEDL